MRRRTTLRGSGLDPDYERSRRLHRPPLPEIGDRFSDLTEPDPIPAEQRAAPTWDYEHAYPGGPMVGPPLPRPLYPPDAAADGYKRSPDGCDVTAWKRAVSRGGRWPWQAFDDAYSNAFSHGTSGNVSETGVAGFQRQMGIDPTGYIGEHTANALRSARVPEGLPHAGEPLLDATAIRLLEDYRSGGGSNEAVRKAIADYCSRSIDAAGGIHYLQQRAMESLGIAPEKGFYADCSEHSTASYWWARQQTGIAVPDPNGSGYNGYGYTGTLIDNPEGHAPWLVGDLAIYGDSYGATAHVCTCYVEGDSASSVWCSHGSEAAPYAVELNYRGDLLVVVRPKLTP